MIESEPNINLSNLVRTIKSYTTYHVWKQHGKYLSKHFGKEKMFWTDGYFICSIGNVSEKQLRKIHRKSKLSWRIYKRKEVIIDVKIL